MRRSISADNLVGIRRTHAIISWYKLNRNEAQLQHYWCATWTSGTTKLPALSSVHYIEPAVSSSTRVVGGKRNWIQGRYKPFLKTKEHTPWEQRRESCKEQHTGFTQNNKWCIKSEIIFSDIPQPPTFVCLLCRPIAVTDIFNTI